MSTIDNAKKGMGWVHPNVRPGCGNCDKVVASNVSGGFLTPTLRCKSGGFLTNRNAICDKHVPMFQTGGKPK